MRKLLLIAHLLLLVTSVPALGANPNPLPSLDRGFINPPDSARMWTWWFWLNNNVTAGSITKDLEAMKLQGLGGVTVFSLAEQGGGTHGPQFLSEEWLRLFRHTLQEAKRLQLKVNANLCSGWNAGGPWVEPENAAKQYTITNILVSGPRRFRGQLPRPPADARLYKDISIQAFPVLAARTNISEKYMSALAYKNGRESFGHYSETPFAQICAAPLQPLEVAPDHPVIRRGELLNLSANCDSDGLLDWDVPEGDWVVLRIGYTLTGSMTIIPTPGDGGLESDPMSKAAMGVHFKNVGERLAEVGNTLTGEVFQSVQLDSWELVPLPNWSPRFRDQFTELRGYDPQPYLAALAGYVVESATVTERFLYDFRKTLADCIADNYYGQLTDLAHSAGLMQQSEAGGVCYPKVMGLDALKNLGRCDIPMGEFWQDGTFLEAGQNKGGKQTASAAHIYGKPLVAAEAFTSFFHWTDSPESLKPAADRAFCEGLNRFFIFSTATRDDDAIPGHEFHAGTHFNRKITWWNQARPFSDYIARCSYLLQQGLFCADVLFYNGDGAPNYVPARHVPAGLASGFDYDVCNTEVLLTRLSVRNGKIILPDGMSYRMLVLPDRPDMPVEVIRKLQELVDAGMTLVGPKPSRDSGLRNYPACDDELKRIAEKLWGGCDGKEITEHRFGRGVVAWGRTPRELLARENVSPDFSYKKTNSGTFIDWIHRRTSKEDIYFVVNRRSTNETVECRFRVSGRQPEIWDPASGTRRNAVAYRQEGDGVSLPLKFEPNQSLFVLFRKPIPSDAVGPRETNFPDLRPKRELTGPWEVFFDRALGGPVSPVVFESLTDWTKRPEQEIRYYSGAATYRKTFDYPLALKQGVSGSRLILKLGTVRNIAVVRLNGQNLGTVWCAPWQVDLTQAIREKGNLLEIDVINLWPNRLIGDGKLPVEKRITRTNLKVYEGPSHQPLESGLLGPVILANSDEQPPVSF